LHFRALRRWFAARDFGDFVSIVCARRVNILRGGKPVFSREMELDFLFGCLRLLLFGYIPTPQSALEQRRKQQTQ
jgi:hypothetical protein